MKHFEIIYTVGSTAFTFECSTAYEALEALSDILTWDKRQCFYSGEMDKLMEQLVRMKNGGHTGFEANMIRVRYVDGEV